MFYYTELKRQRVLQRLSEVELASRARISRLTLRSIESGAGNPTWDSIDAYAKELGFKAELVLVPEQTDIQGEDSIVGVSLLVAQMGFDTWPVYLMNFTDAYRRTGDVRLITLGPVSETPKNLVALFASTVLCLCDELGTDVPSWAKREYFLDEPWFPSDTESLKAMALLESPVFFKKNNIFVLENFLKRA